MRLAVFCLVLAFFAIDQSVSLRFISRRRVPVRRKPLPPVIYQSVDKLCHRVRCRSGQVCRVVTLGSCGWKARHVARCLPCVPKGVDDACNAYSYMRAVLVGKVKRSVRKQKPKKKGGLFKKLVDLFKKKDKKRPIKSKLGKLSAHHCHLGNVKSKGFVRCPPGATCVKKDLYGYSGIGVCCYNKVAKVYRQDEQCGKCKKGCKKGQYCKEILGKCGKLTYRCKPIYKHPKGCPLFRPGVCPRILYKRCYKNKDCPKGKKCCMTGCGYKACLGKVSVKPYPYPVKG